MRHFAAKKTAETMLLSRPNNPPKIAQSHGDQDPHLTHGFLGSRVSSPIGISMSSAIFAGFTNVINRPDRQTNHATLSAALGRYR